MNNENLITLTTLGIEVAKELDYRIKEDADELFKAFNDDDLLALYELLNKML